APEIEVTVDDRGFSVTDNGRGIPPDVVTRLLDYPTRTSTNAAYVSPTRGQLRNAPENRVAAPSVLFAGRQPEEGDPGVLCVRLMTPMAQLPDQGKAKVARTSEIEAAVDGVVFWLEPPSRGRHNSTIDRRANPGNLKPQVSP